MFLCLVVGTGGLVLPLYVIVCSLDGTYKEEGKDVLVTAGELYRSPVWLRYHVRYHEYDVRVLVPLLLLGLLYG